MPEAVNFESLKRRDGLLLHAVLGHGVVGHRAIRHIVLLHALVHAGGPLFIEPLSMEPFSMDPLVMPDLPILSCWLVVPCANAEPHMRVRTVVAIRIFFI